jgi:FtsH-binding integral membrane protein
MEILGMVLMGIGAVIALVYGIILLVKAFQTSVWWGLGYIFVPLVSLIFVIVHWQVAKKPFLMSLISIPFFILGSVLMPHSMMVAPAPQ